VSSTASNCTEARASGCYNRGFIFFTAAIQLAPLDTVIPPLRDEGAGDYTSPDAEWRDLLFGGSEEQQIPREKRASDDSFKKSAVC